MDPIIVTQLENRRKQLEAQRAAIGADLAGIESQLGELRQDAVTTRRRELNAQIAALEAQGKFDEAAPLKSELLGLAK